MKAPTGGFIERCRNRKAFEVLVPPLIKERSQLRIEFFKLSENAKEASSGVSAALLWVEVENLFCRLQEAGFEIQRYEVDKDPLVFAAHTGVAELLRAEGTGALPAIFIDGRLVGQGRSFQVAILKDALAVRGVRV